MNVRGGAAQCSFLEQPVGTGAMGNCAMMLQGLLILQEHIGFNH
jgi:hypothetical protein